MSEGADAPTDHWAELGAWAKARRSPAELAVQCERVQGEETKSHARRKVDAMRKQDRLRQLEELLKRVRMDAQQLETNQGRLREQSGEIVGLIAAWLPSDSPGNAMADFVRQLNEQTDSVRRDYLSQIREVVDEIAAEVECDELAGSDEVMSLAIKAAYLCFMALAWKLDAKGTAARLAAFTPAELDALDELGMLAASRDPVPLALFVLGRMAEALDRVRARKPSASRAADEIAKLAVQDEQATANQIHALNPGGRALREVKRIVAMARAARKYR